MSEYITSGLSLWVFTASTFKKMDSTLQPEERGHPKICHDTLHLRPFRSEFLSCQSQFEEQQEDWKPYRRPQV